MTFPLAVSVNSNDGSCWVADYSGNAVVHLAENDIVSGYADGYYRPTADVTREQMAVYIARAFGLVTP